SDQRFQDRLWLGEVHAWIVYDRGNAFVRRHFGRKAEIFGPAVVAAIPLSELECGFRIPSGSGGGSAHQPFGSEPAVSFRKSSTRRRCRSPVIESPVTLLAAQ